MTTGTTGALTTTELTERECWNRLAEHGIGRIAMVAGGEPVILPIGYAVVPGGLLLRTRPGSKLFSILLDGRVAFEIDDHDDEHGWSVLVVGRAEEVLPRDHVGIPPAAPFAGDDARALVMITPIRVTGRELRLA
ncbi:pyridoxamine 5'-phosphate oxidase family protein [Amnibacterium sp.]|uniref:pyridoxamine 5'-phosphate oxidase family protein n=1 Tax=Amnibacterium sp. TaxID=1872496 RepID=UPI003F7CA96C